MTTLEDVVSMFAYRPPVTDRRIAIHENIRKHASELAVLLFEWLPEGNEKDRALVAVHKASLWAHQSLSVNDHC